MSHLPKVLDALSRLLSYPDQHTLQTAELLYVLLQQELPDAAAEAAAFGAYVEHSELHEVEELFTRTFDVNPACALEVGWHLFGEEYARGMFLVRMREELRKYQLQESRELPDHIGHVLSLVAAMPSHESLRFVKACVQPAVIKMDQALQRQTTAYRRVVRCLSQVIEYSWGPPSNSPEESAAHDPAQRFASDPLRAPRPADVGCGSDCGDSCAAAPSLVSLQMSPPVPKRAAAEDPL